MKCLRSAAAPVAAHALPHGDEEPQDMDIGRRDGYEPQRHHVETTRRVEPSYGP